MATQAEQLEDSAPTVRVDDSAMEVRKSTCDGGGGFASEAKEHVKYRREGQMDRLADLASLLPDDSEESTVFLEILTEFCVYCGFPFPEDVYRDEDNLLCCDWYNDEDGTGIQTCLSGLEKLLVVVDTGDSYLRLPMHLNEVKDRAHLTFALHRVFGNES